MNRKLHNTASALMVPATLLLLALVAHVSGSDAQPPAAPVAMAVASATMIMSDEGNDAAMAPGRKPARANRIRHSVAMPFFSFAPRG